VDSSKMVTAFCIPGGHPADAPTGSLLEGAGLPEGWALVRASCWPPSEEQGGAWIRDKSAPCRIVCCPGHQPQRLVEVVRCGTCGMLDRNLGLVFCLKDGAHLGEVLVTEEEAAAAGA
jgi:hypothetical protein